MQERLPLGNGNEDEQKNHITKMTEQKKTIEVKVVKISDIKLNPNNPRVIKDDKFKAIVKSVQVFPEMLDVREIVCNLDMIIIGGNMRYNAMKEAGYKEATVKIVDWTEEQQRQFIIKDNVGYGEWDWDDLANNWDSEELTEWGLDIPNFNNEDMTETKDNTKGAVICPSCGVSL